MFYDESLFVVYMVNYMLTRVVIEVKNIQKSVQMKKVGIQKEAPTSKHIMYQSMTHR